MNRESNHESRATSDEPQVMSHERRKLPAWLHRPLPASESFRRTERVLISLGLQTICSNANCPNRGECWSKGTATVLILGNVCTRHCGFCSVVTGKPALPDPTEPARLAQMAKQMDLKYLVITSVNRDDLPDGGSGHFNNCLKIVRQQCPDIKFEILTPDFCNCQTEALKILREALPFVFAHNVETVPSLYPVARTGGNYQRSLNLLKMAKEYYGNAQTKKLSQSAECHSERSEESLISTGQTLRFTQGDSFEIFTKSSIMLGLGETDEQVEQVLKDLRNVGCDRITIGQYLKPSKDSIDVVEYLTPYKFDWWRQKALQLGFSWVISSPFARSSYFAEQEAPP